MFSIRFLSLNEARERNLVKLWLEPTSNALGEIVIGEFRETFLSSLRCWKTADYKDQWQRALNLLLSNVETAVLVTSIDGREEGPVTCWPIFKQGKFLLFQNRLIFPGEIELPISDTVLSSFIGKYKSESENDEHISEWQVPIESVASFLGKEFC